MAVKDAAARRCQSCRGITVVAAVKVAPTVAGAKATLSNPAWDSWPDAAALAKASSVVTADMKPVTYRTISRKAESQKFTAGAALFGCLLYIAGAMPSALPPAYFAFFAICYPMRAFSFIRRRWGFFLIDFCYFANLAVCAFLWLAPNNAALQSVVYALADGPLAGALVVWQCALVFGSSSHYVSVLIHLFPGLAMFAHRHAGGPKTPAAVAACARTMVGALRTGSPLTRAMACWNEPPTAPTPPPEAGSLVYTVAAPLAFYLAWQFVYWLVVQVLCRRYILSHACDTSYTTLARRAAKTNNVWNRLVRRGSAARRVILFGLLQLAFTLACLAFFQVLHRSFYAAFLWQVVKFVIPVWYGSRVQCEQVPRRAVVAALSGDLDEVLRSSFPAAEGKRR